MNFLMELVDKFLKLFRPKPRKPTYPPSGIVVTEFYSGADSYLYSVGHGGSGSSDDKEDFSKCKDPEFAKVHSSLLKVRSEDVAKATQLFSSTGSAGEAGSSNTSHTETYPGDPRGGYGCIENSATPLTVENVLREAKEFSRLIDPAAHSVKKKRHKTKKATAAANTADIIEIFKWTNFVTASQLQKASRVRRERFLPLLKKLVKNRTLNRSGTGKRGDPYFYTLNKESK